MWILHLEYNQQLILSGRRVTAQKRSRLDGEKIKKVSEAAVCLHLIGPAA
jgi:hypothetical protein